MSDFFSTSQNTGTDIPVAMMTESKPAVCAPANARVLEVVEMRKAGLTVGEISDRTKLGFEYIQRTLEKAMGRRWHGGFSTFVPEQNEMHVIGVRVGRRNLGG